MKCKYAIDDISAYAEGSLTSEAMDDIKEHIKSCKECLEFYSLLTFTDGYFSSCLEPDSSFHGKMMESLDDNKYNSRNELRNKTITFIYARKSVVKALVLSAAAVILALTVYMNAGTINDIKDSIIAGFSQLYNEDKDNDTGEDKRLNNSADILPALEGTWINEEFFNVLNATKSPLKASKGALSIKFEKGEKYTFAVYLGGDSYSVQIDEFVKLDEKNHYGVKAAVPSGNPIINDVLIIDSPQNIQKITFYQNNGSVAKRESPLVFSRIGTEGLDTIMNREVLAGKYKDQNARVYEFSSDGTAIWPDGSFKYTISIDPYISSVYDCFYTESLEKYYCFEVKDSKLYIYRAKSVETGIAEDPTGTLEREKEPYLILIKES